MEHIYESPDSLRRDEEQDMGHYTPRMGGGGQDRWIEGGGGVGHCVHSTGRGVVGSGQDCGWALCGGGAEGVCPATIAVASDKQNVKSKSAGNYSL